MINLCTKSGENLGSSQSDKRILIFSKLTRQTWHSWLGCWLGSGWLEWGCSGKYWNSSLLKESCVKPHTRHEQGYRRPVHPLRKLCKTLCFSKQALKSWTKILAPMQRESKEELALKIYIWTRGEYIKRRHLRCAAVLIEKHSEVKRMWWYWQAVYKNCHQLDGTVPPFPKPERNKKVQISLSKAINLIILQGTPN